MDKVVLDGLFRTVRFAGPGVELSFGAVAKGWALDRVAATLRVRKVPRALLTAGAAATAAGAARPWELALRPGEGELGTVRLRDAALGTSGAGEQSFSTDGRRYGHVLDPRTGRPAEGVRSASVVTTEAAVADALSTAFLVGGPDLAASFCASRPGTMALLVLDEAPRDIRVFGKRDGVTLEPAAGVRSRRGARVSATSLARDLREALAAVAEPARAAPMQAYAKSAMPFLGVTTPGAAQGLPRGLRRPGPARPPRPGAGRCSGSGAAPATARSATRPSTSPGPAASTASRTWPPCRCTRR